MIPADVASRLQVSADTAQRQVAPTQEIADKLPGLVAGQKVMAEIQSLLPNGTYRAMINQRSITLALPFSAKSGDALELQVTESNGRLALAVVARQDGEGGKQGASTSATLSRTAQLISTLFSGTREAKGGSTAAVPLNSNQPIAGAPQTSAQELLPLLKQAITQSGMFYESHQAGWIEGRFPKAGLLQEPQGRLSTPAAFASDADQTGQAAARSPLQTSAGETIPGARVAADTAASPLAADGGKAGSAQSSAQHANQMVAPQALALVQHQLEALATQNFNWQGQIWPGQEMRWEIDEDASRQGQDSETDEAGKWTTRLQLTLPNLGEIDARVRLQGNQITLSVAAGKVETRALMQSSSVMLRSQLDAAGLTLASIGVDAFAEGNPHGPAGE